jgi:hypothetical protein
MIAGIVSLSTLVIRKNPALLKLSLVLCAFLSFISFGIMGQTAHLGGQIRHYELRHGAASPTENKNGNSEGDETKKEAKDDD